MPITWVPLAMAVLVASSAHAAPPPTVPSAAPVVTLLTMDPGRDLYSRFGHAALMVERPGAPAVVYNFGYTDFGDSALVLHFLRGRTRFWMAREQMPEALTLYQEQGRTVYAQRLRLSPSEAEHLATRLAAWPSGPRGGYLYHHFRDNCATRLRDFVDDATAGRLTQTLRGASLTKRSIRDLVHRGFGDELGLLLLSDLLLGRDVDRVPDAFDAAFLPQYLRDTVIRVPAASGARPSLLADPAAQLYRGRASAWPFGDPDRGTRLLWRIACAYAVVAMLMGWLGRRRSRWLGPLMLLCVAAPCCVALLLFSVCLYSTLPDLRHNELLLLFWPTDFALVLLSLRFLRGRMYAGWTLRIYVTLRLGWVVALIALHVAGVLYQQPLAFIAIAACLFGGIWLALRGMPLRGAAIPLASVIASDGGPLV